MIEAQSVSMRFGAVQALREVTLKVSSGEVLGLLGPNGAGKTTLMRIMAGFFAPTGGRVMVQGLDTVRDSLEARRRVGYFLERLALYPEMRVAQFLGFAAKLKGVPRSGRRAEVERVLAACSLQVASRRIIGQLSKGYRQRVGLAQALLGAPRLLLLDEPTAGLDPEQVVEVRRLIQRVGRESTVVFSSHILSEVAQICDRVAVINRGRLVALDRPERLGGAAAGRRWWVVLEARDNSAEELWGDAGGEVRLVRAERQGDLWNLELAAGEGADLPRRIGELACARGWILRELRPSAASLEEVFLGMVGADSGRRA
jgi:ABC-2 type transport system ATP-binding protein